MRSKNDWWNYLEHRIRSDDELYHHGVLGMHWGIRRYQSYSTVPRKSGKGGKEIGTAKEVFDSLSKKEKKNISTAKEFSDSPTLVKRAIIKDKNGHAQAFAEVERDPDDYSVGYLSVAVHKNDRGQGLSVKACEKVLNDLKDSDLKEIYWETTTDNKASSATARKLGFVPAENYGFTDDNYVLKLESKNEKDDTILSEKTASIKFKPDTGFGYKGETAFSGNPKCLITIEYPEDKKILDRVINNKKLENTMRNHASEMHQYESINPNHEDRDTFKKRLKCDQITIGHTYNPDIVDIWYSHPDDSGAWYMQVNTKNNIIEDEQYYR